MTTFDQPLPSRSAAVLEYFATRETSSGQGADQTNSNQLGRLLHVAEADVGSDPFGRASGSVTLPQKHAAMALSRLILSGQGAFIDFTRQEMRDLLADLADGVGARVLERNDVTAIVNLSQNMTTEAMLINWPNTMSGDDVARARAL